jgi:type II secretory pathway predicted ATPase ExeA
VKNAILMRPTRRYPSSRPFMAAPRVDFYHPAREIDGALHAIERAVRRGEGIGLVVGPAGSGKSLLLAKLAEHLRDDFDVALLSGARICTRRALWQSVLAEIGEPYRGLDEGDLRIGVVDRIRGLAATGSGLVILVDEAHTLPTRLIEELRLLTNVPTPLPAVHIVLVGTADLEERLGSPRMESIAQRIATRHYLEPLDHAETMAYLRTQARAAGTEWERLFDQGCDDAIYSACDGVPRLINQVCDQALVLAGEAGRTVATAADVAAAWREIQRLPPPGPLARAADRVAETPRDGAGPVDEPADDHAIEFGCGVATSPAGEPGLPDADGDVGMIEFGDFDAFPETGRSEHHDHAARTAQAMEPPAARHVPPPATPDPIDGPDVELVLDPTADPFEEFFDDDRLVQRMLMSGPDNFSGHRHVASREGRAMAVHLNSFEPAPPSAPECSDAADAIDDADMVVIEEDILEQSAVGRRGVFAVRPGDYRRLFARLRRGDGA